MLTAAILKLYCEELQRMSLWCVTVTYSCMLRLHTSCSVSY